MATETNLNQIFDIAKKSHRFVLVSDELLRKMINKKYGDASKSRIAEIKETMLANIEAEKANHSARIKNNNDLKKKEQLDNKEALKEIEKYLDEL